MTSVACLLEPFPWKEQFEVAGCLLMHQLTPRSPRLSPTRSPEYYSHVVSALYLAVAAPAGTLTGA